MVSENGTLKFLLNVPAESQRTIASQLSNAFPGSRVEVLPEPVISRVSTRCDRWLRLSPDVLPLVVHQQFVEEHSREAVDPLETLMETMQTGRSGNVRIEYWLHIRTARPQLVDRANRCASTVAGRSRFPGLARLFRRTCSNRKLSYRMRTWLLSRLIRRSPPDSSIVARLQQHLLEVELQISAVGNDRPDVGNRKLDGIQGALKQFAHGDATFVRETTPRHSFLLTAGEVATLWHPPIRSSIVPRVEQSGFRELEPPRGIATKKAKRENSVTLGRVSFRNERYRFGLEQEARRRHLYVVGKTGMGKSTLLQNILAEDIAAGRGCALIEPHGALATNTLKLIPKHRTNHVVYFDPSNDDYAIAFNPLRVPTGGDPTVVADGVLAAFQKIFGLDESQAPRLLHIFRNALLSLVEFPDATLLSVGRLLIDDVYRKSVVAHVSNPIVRSFWLDEFGKWKPHDQTAFIASLQNKLGAFLTNPRLQRTFGQPDSKLDLRQIMDERKILIVNLSKGRLGENASDLLGTLLVTSLQIAAMTRADVEEHQRPDFGIVIDEFQNYATPAVATFLSESRKYRTNLTISHQYTSQLPDDILASILGNVGSMIAFQVGADDGELFARQFGDRVTPENLTNAPKYHAYCRLLVDGMPSAPFSMQTIKSKRTLPDRSAIIQRRSQRTYGRPREQVEQQIQRQLGC